MSTSAVKVRLTTDRVGGYGAIQHAGEVIEVDAETATRMLKSRQAEAVTEDHPAAEAMVTGPDRRAVSRTTRTTHTSTKRNPRGAAAR